MTWRGSETDILETGGVNLLKKDSRPGTPLKKMKQDTARPSTPVRRSRRLVTVQLLENHRITDSMCSRDLYEIVPPLNTGYQQFDAARGKSL